LPVTPKYGFRYPAPADPADVPADLQKLASDVEAILSGRFVPIFASIETQQQVTTGSFGDLATPGPSITLVQAGDYIVSWGCEFSGVPTNAFSVACAVRFGAAATQSADSISFGAPASPSATAQVALARQRRYNGLAAGLVLKLEYAYVNFQMNAAKRWIRADRVA